MHYSEFDEDRMIRVRASIVEDGERRIRELEAELTDKQNWSTTIRNLEGEVMRLRECLKRYEWQFLSNGEGYPNDEEVCAMCEAKRSEGHAEGCSYGEAMCVFPSCSESELVTMTPEAYHKYLTFEQDNSRLRECLKRLIDAHNNDADMDIYDNLIIEATAAIKEGE